MKIETRPSVGCGFSWWLVLRYGPKHEFIDLLPHDFPSLDEAKRDELVEASAQKLQAQLRPILLAEDGDASMLTKSQHTGALEEGEECWTELEAAEDFVGDGDAD